MQATRNERMVTALFGVSVRRSGEGGKIRTAYAGDCMRKLDVIFVIGACVFPEIYHRKFAQGEKIMEVLLALQIFTTPVGSVFLAWFYTHKKTGTNGSVPVFGMQQLHITCSA
jgi:hypothetical protein